MSKPKRMMLNAMASKIIGDGGTPNLFFVTDQGETVTITRSFQVAYAQWLALARDAIAMRIECTLEDRQTGVLCSVGPESDNKGARMLRVDDSSKMLRTQPE